MTLHIHADVILPPDREQGSETAEQQPLRRYVAQADGKLCGYCKEELCNTENGRMIVELYLGKQEHHVSSTFQGSCIEIAAQPQLLG